MPIQTIRSVKLKIAQLPQRISWREFHGMATLCGIGFTMSLLVATLALEGVSVDISAAARLGVLMGSLLSALSGCFLLHQVLQGKADRQNTP